jgi:multidrug efflux pump subunit AcrA (membrane-fusion protein)
MKKMNPNFVIGTVLLISLILSACNGTVMPTPTLEPVAVESVTASVTAEGSLLPSPSVELAFAQGGVIGEVLVKPGKQVAKGDALIRLIGVESIQAELAAAQLEQTYAQIALQALQRSALFTAAQTEKALLDAQKAYESAANGWNLGDKDNATDIEVSIDDYVNAEEKYSDAREGLIDQLDKDEGNAKRKDAQNDFDREEKALAEAYADLLAGLAVYNQPLTDKQIRVLSTIGALEAARQDQSRLDENNLDTEVITATQSRLMAATTHVAAAEAMLKLYELQAPFDGTILSANVNSGETAYSSVPVVFLADTHTWIVETKDLAEIDIARVALGQKATVLLDAFPGEELNATVTAIEPIGKEYLGDITYKVTVTLDETDDRFMWFMTATVTIQIGD